MSKLSDTRRDRSRSPDAKARVMSRRNAQRGKSALRFLCIAFPAELASFGSAAR
jgi:hypothetical protein